MDLSPIALSQLDNYAVGSNKENMAKKRAERRLVGFGFIGLITIRS